MDSESFSKRYEVLSDAELINLAQQLSTLVPEAQEALSAELQKRSLGPIAEIPEEPDRLPPIPPEYADANIDPDELVVIRRFRDFPEAMMARATLDSAGIQCAVLDENIIRMNWLGSNAFGGLKLAVRQEDAETALDVLEQAIPDQIQLDGQETYEQRRCPNCSALDIQFEEFDKKWSAAALWVNLPLLISTKRWRCNACGHSWKETTDEQSQYSKVSE
jgi:hypothetical protein